VVLFSAFFTGLFLMALEPRLSDAEGEEEGARVSVQLLCVCCVCVDVCVDVCM